MSSQIEDKVEKTVGHLDHKVPPVVTGVNKQPQIMDRISYLWEALLPIFITK